MTRGMMLQERWNTRLLDDLRRQADRWRRAVTDLLFPPRCVWCDRDLGSDYDDLLLCEACQAMLGPEEWASCRRCGAAAPAEGPPPEECHLCRGAKFRFETVVPLGGYRGELREAILRMKRAFSEPLSTAMGRLFASRRAAQVAAFRPDLIVPIPMHWLRRTVRKTNSPDFASTQLGRELGVPVYHRALRRCRNTSPQKDMPPRKRFQNVRGAFRLAMGYDFRGKRVVLMDDVMTTGATCSEAAGTLLDAGAETVAVAVLARAEGDDQP